MRTLATLAASFALLGPALSSHARVPSNSGVAMEQDQPPRLSERVLSPVPLLSVTADAHIFVAPDLATVRLGVFAQEKEATAAQNHVNEAMAKIVTAVRGQGVPAEQIQTAGLNLSPLYSQPRAKPSGEMEEPRITGYRADSTITIRLKDLKRTGAVIDAALANGANQLQGITFGLQDETPSRTRALQQASRAAREKATAMASALDVRLVELAEASEGGADVIRPMYLGRGVQMDAMQASVAPTPVEAGQVDITASVTLRYRIGPADKP
jgi:uncharacterized protein